MSQNSPTPSAEEAREMLARAEGIGTSATSAASWPAAMVFNSLAILGSMLMIGFHIVAHTGYGAALLAVTVGIWAAINATIWPLMQRTTKTGFTKRFLTSLFAYMGLYAVALLVGAFAFPNGSLAYYITAAVVLAVVGLAAAFRELRA
ncbi:hypothetical protein NHF46_04275 [Arthrobacter alpinus]|uniref:Uncharacterized protein n=1 Tax=Arthrobacter alpinus TaxID=656366 RepID=A0A0S2M2C3_9MICC|nr:hypothetical protein [Arthrobacter alpinus]ALO67740.1 hypothetical protein AS189_16220 [Arthrobacter alpinus]MDD0857212.1 hypothetical protein [Arthrobacter alpinus]